MMDRSIPFVNVIMKGEARASAAATLPEGYVIRRFRPGDEVRWAEMEHAVGDFSSCGEALDYFREAYLAQPGELERRMLVAADAAGQAVGSCIAWRDARGEETVASLHWLIVDPAHQGKGLGRALCRGTMNVFHELGETPVYIHTQPWSHVAVRLYADMGFRMQKADAFSHYENQYERAMEVLSAVLPDDVMERLRAEAEE